MAKAVVSTSIGAEGLPVKSGEHLLVADTPSSFAENTLRLLGDPSRREQIGQGRDNLLSKITVGLQFPKALSKLLENVMHQTAR